VGRVDSWRKEKCEKVEGAEQKNQITSPKGTKPQGGLHAAARTDRHLKSVTGPWHTNSWHQPPLPAGAIPTSWLQTFYTHLVYSTQIPLRVLSATAKPLSGHFQVWIPNLGALPIMASVSLTHLPFLCACFYESLSCVYAVFFTCLSPCVARAACLVFGSVSITTFLFSFSFFYTFNRHLCHGAYSCTHKPANMRKLFFHLHVHLSSSYVRVYIHVYAFPSSSMSINTYRHIHTYVWCSVLYWQPARLLCNDPL